MLIELRIEDFAIIHQLKLSFSDGLITFTGETGAGKSIILDAIMALLGGRADNELIRSTASTALVEATFKLTTKNRREITHILENEALLDDENPDEIILSRELRSTGRSIARINGRSVSVSLLREIGSLLVDIHGQSDHLSLLNERNHLPLLDRYTDNNSLLNDYRSTYKKLVSLRKELNELRKNEHEAAQQKDFLTFQINEIQNARLTPGEDEDLRQERDRLANAEKLADITQQCLIILEGGGEETPSTAELLGQLARLLGQLSRIDASQAKLLAQAEESIELLNDAAVELQDYQEQVEYNPRRLVQVEERLNMIHNLRRKYGPDIEAILSHAKKAQEKLMRLTHSDERISEIEHEEALLLEKLADKGMELSLLRRKAAEDLSRGVERELNDLNMVEAQFKVDQQYQSDPDGLRIEDGKRVHFDSSGLDKITFLIAPNPGEGFKPLAKTASGGETSRLMLALKNVLVQADFIPTLIFDEIDQGIGGRVGAVVGEKLWQLAREHQVLCVTHLPQLAAFGNQHFRVHKRIDGGRTFTLADPLSPPERVDELSVMLGAASTANRSAAVEALRAAQKRIKELSR